MQLHGATVLLTGATGGIGRSIARALDARGARVLLSARREDVLEEIRAELGGRPECLPADLSDADGAAALAERAGTVDVLVANAALPASGAIDGFSDFGLLSSGLCFITCRLFAKHVIEDA